jgi:hypothetical protein
MIESCPRCGSTKIIPIAYGYPSAEMRADAEAGRVELGGCVIESNMPTRRCTGCQHAWSDYERGRLESAPHSRAVVTDAVKHCADELAGRRVLCPACESKVFEQWPLGWDGHALVCAGIDLVGERDRKHEFRTRFGNLFRSGSRSARHGTEGAKRRRATGPGRASRH